MSSISTSSPNHSGRSFHRYELKLLLHSERADFVRAWARRYLQPDPHTGPDDTCYLVSTLYLDSPELDVYHRLLDDGAKYRIRRYGIEDQVFLERKLRQESFVRKKRRPWPLERMKEVLKGKAEPSGWPGVFKRRVLARRLGPTALVTYTRHAWTCGPHARLTVDSDIRAWAGKSIRRWEREGAGARIPGGPVVELKYAGPRPVQFDALLESLDVEAGSFSKYGRSIEALGLAVTAERCHA